jgi:hypothetical protein
MSPPVPLPIVGYPSTTGNKFASSSSRGRIIDLRMVIGTDWGVSLLVLECFSKFVFIVSLRAFRYRSADIDQHLWTAPSLARELVLRYRCAEVSSEVNVTASCDQWIYHPFHHNIDGDRENIACTHKHVFVYVPVCSDVGSALHGSTYP